MNEEIRAGSGTRERHVMTPHEMLAASARLGSYSPGHGRSRSGRFVPVEYDESGYPIPGNRASFAERVRQLLRG
jgi:hypothetical protein